MNIKDMNPVEAIELIKTVDDIADVRIAAGQLGIKFSGNSGIDTLKTKIVEFLSAGLGDPNETVEETDSPISEKSSALDDIFNGPDPTPPVLPVLPKLPAQPTVEDLLAMDPNKLDDPLLIRKVVRAKALRLVRVKITNLDPSDAMLSGAIITVANRFIGKVSKFIPFGEETENGYHVPQVILNELRAKRYPLRKEISSGKNFGVKRYSTTMVPKFSIEVLTPLTEQELTDLKLRQGASA